ncbi:hypothetical protein [Oceanobacillus locisalsi]|uniref:GRAM domain-containing protein n=1 Tax=Oceanobacillus locisalsi TaxID=546107 RepID=A0ABW3NBG1_9BACI
MSERIIKKGKANLWKQYEASGGTLLLTEKELTHRPHGVNIQSNVVSIGLKEIEQVELSVNKLLFIRIPNGVTVTLRNGEIFKFVVFGRRKWKEEIEHAIKQFV